MTTSEQAVHPLALVEERVGYRFADRGLLGTALTHSSYAHENDVEDNERLEFLGDAVLQMTTTLLLMRQFPVSREGELSRLRARLVNTRALAAIARELELGPALRLGVGEEGSGGRTRTRNLGNAVEALLGAIHRDAGFETCLRVVEGWMTPRMEELANESQPRGQRWKDPVSRLQELTQRRHRQAPRYRVIDTEGPDHALVFHVAVELDGETIGTGKGRRKRDAFSAAAAAALANLAPGEVEDTSGAVADPSPAAPSAAAPSTAEPGLPAAHEEEP